MLLSLALLFFTSTPTLARTSYFVASPIAVEILHAKTLKPAKSFLLTLDVVEAVPGAVKEIKGEEYQLVKKLNYDFTSDPFGEAGQTSMTIVRDEAHFNELYAIFQKDTQEALKDWDGYVPDSSREFLKGYVPKKSLSGFSSGTALPPAITKEITRQGFRILQPHDFSYLTEGKRTASAFYQPPSLPTYQDEFKSSTAVRIPYAYEMGKLDKIIPSWKYQPVVELKRKGGSFFFLHLIKEKAPHSRALALAKPDGSLQMLEEMPDEPFHQDYYFHLVPQKLPILFEAKTRRFLQENYNVDFSAWGPEGKTALAEKSCRRENGDWRDCPAPASRSDLPSLFRAYESAHKKIDFMVYTSRGESPAGNCPRPEEETSCGRWILFFEGGGKPKFFPENCEDGNSFWKPESNEAASS